MSLEISRNTARDYMLEALVDFRLCGRRHSCTARAPVPFEMLEDREAESDNSLGLLHRCRRSRRASRTQHIVDAIVEQLVLAPEVRIERRSADVCAVQDLL